MNTSWKSNISQYEAPDKIRCMSLLGSIVAAHTPSERIHISFSLFSAIPHRIFGRPVR